MKRNWANRRSSTVITDSETDTACFRFHLALLISISILSSFLVTQDPELRIRTQKEAARTMHYYHTYVEPNEANIEPNDASLKDRP